MAKGWGKVEQVVQEKKERDERFASSSNVQQLFAREIKNGSLDGGPLIVRFLEQGNEGPNAVNSFDVHEYKKPDEQYPRRVTCLREINQDCPACRAGMPVKLRGVYNLIIRQRAVLRRDKDGKALKDQTGNYIVDGRADQVVVFQCASTTAAMIANCDHGFQGLMSRDLSLGLTGDKFQPYTLFPVDINVGPQPMTDADMALAAGKYDLDKVMAPPTAQEMAQIVARYGANSGASQSNVPVAQQAQNQQPTNQFLAGANLPASAFGAAQQPVKPLPIPNLTPTTNQ
jgi:hypothetical protein